MRRIGVTEERQEDRSESVVLRQNSLGAPEDWPFDPAQKTSFREFVRSVRHQPSREDDQQDRGHFEERPEVDAPAEGIDEDAEADRAGEAEDAAEELPLPRRGEQQQRELDAFADHGEEHQEEETPGRATALQCGRHTAL